YVVEDVKAIPATVKVRGAERVLAALSAMRTDEINLDGRGTSFTTTSLLALPEGVDPEGSQEVSVQVVIKDELVTQKLPGLVVEVRGDDAAKWKVSPTEVEVTMTGELLAIEKAVVTAVVKVPTDGKPHDVDVTIEGLSGTVGRKISPERVHISPIK